MDCLFVNILEVITLEQLNITLLVRSGYFIMAVTRSALNNWSLQLLVLMWHSWYLKKSYCEMNTSGS